jgi:hypothetical protein
MVNHNTNNTNNTNADAKLNNTDVQLLTNTIIELEKKVAELEKNNITQSTVIKALEKNNKAQSKTINMLKKLLNADVPDNKIIKAPKVNNVIKKRISPTLRQEVWVKYFGDDTKGICSCCGIREIFLMDYYCRRNVSERFGGTTTLDNLRPVCRLCDRSVGTKTMDDFMEEYGLNNVRKKKPNINIIDDE